MTGFQIVGNDAPVTVTVESLTVPMLLDLILFFSLRKDPADVEARTPTGDMILNSNNKLVSLSLMNYPIIPKEVVSSFYSQLERVTIVIKDVILGHFHTDNEFRSDGIYMFDGSPCATIDDLKYWCFHIIKRDFFLSATWMYEFAHGDFERLKPFLNRCIDLFVAVNDHGDFDIVCSNIRTKFAIGNE